MSSQTSALGHIGALLFSLVNTEGIVVHFLCPRLQTGGDWSKFLGTRGVILPLGAGWEGELYNALGHFQLL